MITIGLSGAQVTHLVHLLTAVAAHANDDDRYELRSSRSQLSQQMPAVEVLVLAGVLSEMTERPGLDGAAREDCRRWSDVLNRLLSSASATSWASGSITAGERLAA
jgi:hypothetical protein